MTQRPRDSLRVVSKFLRSAHEPLNLVSLLVLPIHDNPSTAGPTASVLDGNADLIVVGR